MLSRFLANRAGHTAIEYSMIAACIALLIIGALTAMGPAIETMFADLLPAFTGPSPG